MAEYIERRAVEEMLENAQLISDGEFCGYCTEDVSISEIPAADVAPVVHGRWVLGKVEPGCFTPGGNRPWICSECGRVVSWMLDKPRENYCPNCGADMRGAKQ